MAYYRCGDLRRGVCNDLSCCFHQSVMAFLVQARPPLDFSLIGLFEWHVEAPSKFGRGHSNYQAAVENETTHYSLNGFARVHSVFQNNLGPDAAIRVNLQQQRMFETAVDDVRLLDAGAKAV